MLTFAFMHHPYLVCILFGMSSLHLFTFLVFLYSCIIYITRALYFASWGGGCAWHLNLAPYTFSKITLVSEILNIVFLCSELRKTGLNHGASGSGAQDNDSSAFTQQRNCHQRGGNAFTEPQK